MAIELHHLHTGHDDEVARLKARIAELEDKSERLSNALDKEHSETIKYMDELCNAKNEIERLTIDKRNAELRADVADATVEKLKANKQNLEDFVAYFQKKASDFQLMSDIRRVRIKEKSRALWLARAERAHVITLLWNIYCYQENCLYFRDFMNIKCNPFRSLPKKTAIEWSDLWKSIETKCRNKAKKF